MALTQTWALQGTTPTTLGATDSLAFSDGTFGNAITVGSYQVGSHVRASNAADSSAANTPKNVMYVASGTCSVNGAATSNVADCTTANATLKITISEASAITLSAVTFYAYDGTTTTTAPVGLTFQCFQAGVDTAWTAAGGSGAAMALDGATFLNSATDHYAYVAVSATPTSVGVKSANKMRIEFTYQ